MFFPGLIRAALLVCAGLLPNLAFGMERIVLTNGFSVDCHHRAAVADGRTRLFLNEDESSYLDVESLQIRTSERLASSTATGASKALDTAKSSELTAAKTIDTLIAEQGAAHRLNTELLKSVVLAESGGKVRAVSRAGARGLMQLMPATAATLGVADSFAPDQNLQGGTTYLDQMLARYHDNLPLALAAYNAGPGAVDRYHGMPPFRETQAYVARIIREFNRRSLLAQRSAAVLVKPVQ